MQLDCDVCGAWPGGFGWLDMAERAAHGAAQVAPELANPRLTASVLFTDDGEIRTLNARWRSKDRPTNVLSFPMIERADLLALAEDDTPEMLGDIALAYETCAREAAEKDIPLADHAMHLLIHGFLHLAGYDHEISAAHAKAMEHLEVKALALIGVADPYAG